VPPNFRSRHGKEVALLALLATLWGVSYAFIRVGVETFPPLTLIAARTGIAAAALLAILRWRGIELPRNPRLWSRFVFQACLNSAVPFTLIAWAEQRIGAGIATLLNASAPIFVFLLTWALRNGPATRRQLFGVACGMSGTLAIVGLEALAGVEGQLIAELAIVAATFCYAGAAVFGRTFERLDPMVPAAGSLLAGTMMLAPVSLIVDRPWTLAPSLRSMAALLCLALFSTALALTLYFRLIRTLGTVGAAAQAYLRVPIGVAIGAVLLGEPITWSTLAGVALVMIGVAAMAQKAGANAFAPARARCENEAAPARANGFAPTREGSRRSRPSPSAGP
jgi:drug/metabolite transporter (DMT)-like permease